MESLSEFKRTVYKPENNIPLPDVIYDIPSFRFSYFLVKCNLTANQVSSLGFLFGMLSLPFFIFNTPLALISGGLLLFISHLFDATDGKVARYRTEKNLPDEPLRKYGGFFDWLSNITIPLIFVCISVGILIEEQSLFFVILGVLTGCIYFFNYGLLHLIESLAGKDITEYNKFSLARGYINNVCTIPFVIISIGILGAFTDFLLLPIFVVFYFFTSFFLLLFEMEERDAN